MRVSEDELAGVVELFGGLTRDELYEALSELAYREGEELDGADAGETLDSAISSYHLVEYESDAAEKPLLVAGPRAFPEQPPHSEDLPHIMDVEPRDVDREALGEAVRETLDDEATAALAGGDTDRMRELVDVSYDLEAWAPVDCTGIRNRLDARL
ncbi:DUF7109 family protein [Haloarchaeobius amylolyticus]|uniref:DUF7109 family protein n=1 Tax=Haloarchaeobius amylolyticus TaxID=1198296 RepID=UPI002271C664|nr:hypothetical protein [Haloarchaeobius amylolyticus]